MKKSSNIKIDSKNVLVIVKFFAFLGGLAVLGYAGFFLYENLYQVMTESEQVEKLQKSIADENINMKNFEKVMSNLEKKKRVKDAGRVNNPFD
ncbi:hypothetical protein GF382_01365 [Candidatus Falkowbacteria bacterium]|nr:hypothetical protein [Candidatus Falkowbacteria bacterium]